MARAGEHEALKDEGHRMGMGALGRHEGLSEVIPWVATFGWLGRAWGEVMVGGVSWDGVVVTGASEGSW